MGAGIFGSSASTTSKQSTTTTNQNVQDSAGAVTTSFSARKSTVNVTDGGAIAGMVDVSKHAISLGSQAVASGQGVAIAGLDYAQAAYSSSLDLVGRTLDKALAQSSQVAKSSTQTDAERMTTVALWAIGAFALAFLLPKLKGI